MLSKALLLFLLGLVLAAEAKNLQNEPVADLASDLGSIDDRTSKQWSGKTFLSRRKRDTSSSMESAELDVEASEMIKYFLRAAWNRDKLGVLSGFLSELSDPETNLTVVGWQNVFADDGNVKEFNVVQFVVPPKPETNGEGAQTNGDGEEEDIDEDFGRLIPHTLVNRLREVYEPMKKVGISASAIFEEYNKAGEPEVRIFLDKYIMWLISGGFEVYNKTVVASAEEVKSVAELIQNDASIKMKGGFTYGPDGKLGKDYNPAPYFLGSVIDAHEVTDDILLESPAIMADVWVKYPRGEVSKELAKTFNKKWPEYKWRVIIDAQHFYVSRDISVTLSVDNLDFDETSDISYMVYGRKTESPSQ